MSTENSIYSTVKMGPDLIIPKLTKKELQRDMALEYNIVWLFSISD